MDTVKNFAKRIARRILARELQRLHEDVVAAEAGCASAWKAVSRYDSTISKLHSRLSQNAMRLRAAKRWASNHSPANLEARALLEYLDHDVGGPSYGIVHPFDRWGISPKP